MGFAVGFVDNAALGAAPAGVARVNGDDRDASKLRFVAHEATELSKTPPVQTAALCFPGLNPFADMRQVFDRNRKPRAFSVGSNLLRDAVVNVLPESGLPTRQLLKTALGGFGGATLQSLPPVGKLLSDALDIGAGIGATFGVEGEVHDAEVNAEDALDINLCRVRNVAQARYHLPLTSIRSTSPLR